MLFLVFIQPNNNDTFLTIFDLITSQCAQVVQKYWEIFVVKCVPTYTKGAL